MKDERRGVKKEWRRCKGRWRRPGRERMRRGDDGKDEKAHLFFLRNL
jgi:hypothetical protein